MSAFTVRLKDGQPYTDPPAWMPPVRHALGGLLIEAELLFWEDLGFVKDFPRRRAKPNNIWSPQGLHECFVCSGKFQEALSIRAPLGFAVATSDVS